MTCSAAKSLSPGAFAARGLQRDLAARYIGVGSTKFDELVADGRMPKPRRIDGRKVWDRLELDAGFDALPNEQEENPWDRLTA